MDDADLLRYSRHLLLDELGMAGQTRIMASHALVVGAGGLGCPVALYLTAAGIGTITLADPDRINLTNLQRQIAYDTANAGELKAIALARRLCAINPQVTVSTLTERLAGDALLSAVEQADIVLDCSDTYSSRHAINRACVRTRTPLVSGAALRFDGQISVFDSRVAKSPCYHCLYPQTQIFEEALCATMGIFAPLVGIIGSLQANEALKLLAQVEGSVSLCGRLLMVDALNMDIRTLTIKKLANCAICGDRYD